MAIAAAIQNKLKANRHIVYITEADELMAAWQFKRKHSARRSMNLSAVPTEWRMSAPPDNPNALMPCHVIIRRKSGRTFTHVKPTGGNSTMDCHGHGGRWDISAPDLDALEAVIFAKRNIAPWPSPIMDMATLALVCKDLGIAGTAIPKVINNRQYIAFSGYPGLRTHLPGTLYSIKNQKIVKMAIGALGIRRMVRNGGLITLCITVPLTIVECFLSDNATLPVLVGSLASELMKVGIGALMGTIFGIAAGGFTALAFVPITTAILVSVGVGFSLNFLDDKYQLTQKLTAVLKDLNDQVENDARQALYSTQRSLSEGFYYILRSGGLRAPLHR